jgi:hypothetical protein
MDEYQAVGPAVLQANRLLLVLQSHGQPGGYSEKEYKNLLYEDYKPMYDRLQPYRIQIQKIDSNFIVQVYDYDLLILTDCSRTGNRIECWNYKDPCDPDSVKARCGAMR